MTRLLIGFDAAEAARASITVAAALFPGAEAVVATVQPPPPALDAGPPARAALPDAVLLEGVERLRARGDERSRETAAEGVQLADASGLRAVAAVLTSTSPWRALRGEARRGGIDVLVCGTRGEGPVDRVLLGSTASSLLYHAHCPLLVVPAADVPLDGPLFAGYDESEGARRALRFAADHLRERTVIVGRAWRSPVRHGLRGHALLHSGIETLEDYASALETIWREIAEETAEDGATFARGLGLSARVRAPESGRGEWQALLNGARDSGAAALLVGSRGRGAAASTVLGSVTSGLVHAAALPVLVIPAADPGTAA